MKKKIVFLFSAMIHAGQGAHQINNFLSELNLPCPSTSTLKSRENEIGVHFEQLARQSMDEALEEEARTGEDLAVAADVGWQERGSGHAYNSLTGK